MVWLDVTLKGVAVASTIIATLRAGSRAVYLIDHDAIGIMDGPLIRKPGQNETSPLFELSEAFRHCIRLSIVPHIYDKLQTEKPVSAIIDPVIPLSSLPFLIPKSKKATTKTLSSQQEEQEALEEEIDLLIKEATQLVNSTHSSSSSFLQRQLTGFKEALTSTSSRTKKFFSSFPKATQSNPTALTKPSSKTESYWFPLSWNWRNKKQEKEEIVDLTGTEDTDWDYSIATQAELRFNATVTVDEGETTTTTRVAELAVFSPDTFRDLRSIFQISEDSYRQSMFGSGPFVSFQSNSKGAARVGGVFFFTRDGAYMIKTIKKEEAKTFLKMLPKYHHHMRRHGRKSLLTRFCGMYGVRISDEDSTEHGQLHTFVVMNSVFPAEASTFISERFDLKGSTVGREVSEEELRKKGNDAVLKDLDLAREVELVRSMEKSNYKDANKYGLSIGAAAKAALLSQLREDVKLLVDCQVMDYSLLVGVVNMDSHFKLDQSARKALEAIQEQDRLFAQSKRKDERLIYALAVPVKILIAPPVFIARKVWSLTQRTVSSVITLPLPYYGSGKCGVDGGLFSAMHGTRRGDRAVFYMGLIDFLQPWTARKVLERKMKGVMGYDTTAISCVTPEEYATRFLEFLDAHVS